MSKIEWTDVTWNPVTGCDKVSQGCKNCYAEVMHKRLRGMFPEKYSKPFLGHVQTHEDELLKPLSWKKPRMVFVNSMSDLFHHDVPFEFIDHVFAVMAATPQHTYQILTKRPDRMLEYFRSVRDYFDCPNAEPSIRVWNIALTNFSKYETTWPLQNVWLGTSVEDQKTADERIPYLLQVPAAVRFLSCEPLLGPIDLLSVVSNHVMKNVILGDAEASYGIQWVIVGGESGNKARPMHPDWVRSLRDQCNDAKVPFFFKQWGEWGSAWKDIRTDLPVHKMYTSYLQFTQKVWRGDIYLDLDGNMCKSGGDMQRATYPVAILTKMGKKQSGNLLDGVQHLEFPENKKLITT